MKRVLLLETRTEEKHHHHKTHLFPFMSGLLKKMKWPRIWLVAQLKRDCHRNSWSRGVDLPEDMLSLLAAQLEEFRPDIIITNNRPSEDLRAKLLRFAPRAKIIDLTEKISLTDKIGRQQYHDILNHQPTVYNTLKLIAGGETLSRSPNREKLLQQAVSPCYERKFLLKEDENLAEEPLRLALDIFCPYKTPVRKNRYFRDLDSPVVLNHKGCSFCRWHISDRQDTKGRDVFLSQIKLALRQIEAHQNAAHPGRIRFEYIFEESVINLDLSLFIEAVLSRKLRPSTFITMLRADVLLRQRKRLEKVLPHMKAAGHCLDILSIGVENFSEEENERFNKNLSPAQVWECYDMLRDFEARYPGAFKCSDKGYFSAILFTPWTTPSDLRKNLEAAKRLGVEWLKKAIGTRLQLWDDIPLTELARRDGLLSERFSGSLADIAPIGGISDPDLKVVPWRFADPRTALIHSIIIRLDPIPEQAIFGIDDPLVREIRQRRRLLPGRLARDYISLVLAVVDAAEALGSGASLDEIFRHIAANFETVSLNDLSNTSDEELFERNGKFSKGIGVGPGELRFDVSECGNGGAELKFRVSEFTPGRKYFRKIGRFILWYSHDSITGVSAIFAKAIIRAMKELQSVAPSAETIAEWERKISGILAGTGLEKNFNWKIYWVDP